MKNLEMAEILDPGAVRFAASVSSKKRLLQDIADHANTIYGVGATEVFTAKELLDAQTLLRRMPVGDSVVELILDLVRAFRPDDPDAPQQVRETVAWGPGPRAAQALA